MEFVPATKKQLWALFCIYKKDFRDLKISLNQASDIISKSKELSYDDALKLCQVETSAEVSKEVIKKVSKSKDKFADLEEYLFSETIIDKLIKTLIGEFNIKSIVKNDTNFVKDDGKRFVFLGGGCGFSHIVYDKRNKNTGVIIERAYKLKKKVEQAVITKIGKETIDYLESVGNPIQAHMLQNLQYNNTYNYIIIWYLESKGIKNVSTRTHYD